MGKFGGINPQQFSNKKLDQSDRFCYLLAVAFLFDWLKLNVWFKQAFLNYSIWPKLSYRFPSCEVRLSVDPGLKAYIYSWIIGVRTWPWCPKMHGAKYIRSIISNCKLRKTHQKFLKASKIFKCAKIRTVLFKNRYCFIIWSSVCQFMAIIAVKNLIFDNLYYFLDN